MVLPRWSMRAATAADAATLCDIVVEATKAQGRWAATDAAAETAWRAGFTAWCVELVESDDPADSLRAIEVNGVLIGRLRVCRFDADDSLTPGRIELAGIQLRPAWQGRGIGTAIISGLQDEAALEQVPLDLQVEKDNPSARRLYDRLGWVMIGEDEQEHRMRWVPPATP